MKKEKREQKFTMEFEPTTIEHLGLKLYSTLPPVIGELVSNAWDGDATKVQVSVPAEMGPDTEVVVKDDGRGMDAEDFQEQYLRIGRNRRDADGTDRSDGGRRVTGRKGLGKLSAFGVASELEIRSVVKGNATCLRLVYEDMKNWPHGKPYEPTFVQERSGKTKDHTGTEVRLRGLHRKRPVEEAWIRRELARRFTLIGSNFQVLINGNPIAAADRRLKEDCREWWDVSKLHGRGIVDTSKDWKVVGWIGLVEKSSQTERGVDVFARGKAVELDTMFGLKTTHAQFARAYVVGEVHAEFLDAEDDYIATARNSATWESDAGQALQEWGSAALKDVFDRWLELQRREKEERIIKVGKFDEWLKTRSSREQRVAMKILKAIIDDPNIEPETAGPLLEVVKANVEYTAFQEMVDDMEDASSNVQLLLKLFEEWRVIEAREHLKLSDGRLEAMEQLSQYIESGALEVQEMQPLFERDSWLIDPTWGNASGQTTYTALLRKEFPEDEKKLEESERRIDILGIRVSGEVHVVELKRPEKALSRRDLEQIERYVDWARGNLVATGDNSPRYVRGRLIVGKLSKGADIKEKVRRLAGDDIRVETYADLLERARSVYGEVERRLKDIAPEYSRESRRKRKAKAPSGKE